MRLDFMSAKAGTSLNYLVADHSGIDPGIFIEPILDKFSLGVLVLGIDGPPLMSHKLAERLIEGFREDGFCCDVRFSFPWFEPGQARSLLGSQAWASCEGDAFLLKTNPPSERHVFRRLPEPRGFGGDKISKKNMAILDVMLGENDLYFHDDFVYCFIVSKNKQIFDLALEKVRQIADEGK